MSIVWILAATATIWFWGDLAWRLSGEGRAPATLRGGAGWLIGTGLVSWATFLLLWAGMGLNSAVWLLSTLGALLWAIHPVLSPRPASGRGAPGGTVRALRGLLPRRLASGEDGGSEQAEIANVRASGIFRLASEQGRDAEDERPSFWTRFASHRRLWLPGAGPARRWLGPLFALVIAAQVAAVAAAALLSPLTAWDAWVNFASKARILFLDQALTPAIYNDPSRLPTNLDYPLMLPLVEAWFHAWLGHAGEPAVRWIALLYFAALLALFHAAVRRLAGPAAALGFTALLATAPRVERGAHHGLADLPLAALVLLAFLLLERWRDRPAAATAGPWGSVGRGWLVAASLGLLPWMKKEGWIWLALAGLTFLAILRAPGGRLASSGRGSPGLPLQELPRQGASSGRAWRRWSRGARWRNLLRLAPIPALALPWTLFLWIHGTQRYAYLPLTLPNLLGHLERAPAIAGGMIVRLLNPYWNFIWLFAGLALLARRRRALRARQGYLIVPVLAFLALAGASYLLSRFDPFLEHLANSAERLMLQALPLALWWLAGQTVAAGWIEPAASTGEPGRG